MATTVDYLTGETASRTQNPNVLTSFFNSFLLRKFIKTLFTIFFVTTLIFFMVRLLPGNPVEQYVNQLIVQYGMPLYQARDQAASLFAFNLDQPVYLQYLHYLGNLLQGNLGKSILSPGTSVTSIILRFLPWTLFSVGLGLIVSFIIGTLLGLLMAYRRDS